MEPVAERLSFYGQPSPAAQLEWQWVHAQLESAGTYWVIPRENGHPHPRPVWGVWDGTSIYLTVGSPAMRRALGRGPEVTVHLDSGTDVVIVEGRFAGQTLDPAVIQRYNTKYSWSYAVDEFGALSTVTPSRVIAWRAGGRAGRDGFQKSGRWRF